MAEGIPIGGNPNIGPSQASPGLSRDGMSQGAGEGFESLVKSTGPQEVSSKPSPMNVAQGAQPSMQTGQVNAQNLVSNMKMVLGQMAGLQAGLQTPYLKLNARTKRLLDAKLKRTKDNINFIHSKVNVGDEDPEDGKKNAQDLIVDVAQKKGSHHSSINKFINYLTDGQSQLEGAMQSVSHLNDKKDPSLMLENIFSMQVKLYRAQVEIEFSTAVLQKAVDDLKTLMSVQL